MALSVRHRLHTLAPPERVWVQLSDPGRWPAVELTVARVEGASGPVAAGQHLLVVLRPSWLRVPVDVRVVEADRRLVVTVRVAPGLTQDVDVRLRPRADGGTDVTVRCDLTGPFAPTAWLPAWLSTALTGRVLVRRSEGRPLVVGAGTPRPTLARLATVVRLPLGRSRRGAA